MKRLLVLILISIALQHQLQAQLIDPKKTIKRKAEDRLNRKTDDAIDRGLDKLEEGIGNLFKRNEKNTNQSPTPSNSSSSTSIHQNNSNSQVNNTNQTENYSNNQPSNSYQSNSNFDFEPGNKVLYFDNFERLQIGDFPAEFNTNASGEIVTVDGKPGKWLKMTKNGAFIPESIHDLPENFTLEFEVGILGNPSNNYTGLALNFTTDKNHLFRDNFFGKGSSVLYLHPGGDQISFEIFQSNQANSIKNEIPMPQWTVKTNRFAKISIWRQKGRLRVYVNNDKLVDAPRFFSESKPYQFAFSRRFFNPCDLLITNIRFAIAGEDNRNKLITEGRFVTTGIQFDVNSDAIKPESGVVLKEMATTLQENPTVNIKIIGHTDSDGDANANLVLSQKRAVAVKNALINFYGISASRIQTEGKGESEPVKANTSEDGKAQNRRVEFIKL